MSQAPTSFHERRIIYMIRPKYLLEDVLRALRKLGLEPSLRSEAGSWLITAEGPNCSVEIVLRSEEKVVRGLEVLGRIHITELTVSAEGPGDFIEALRYRLEVELLRCLG
ncbi:MAG TPA: hypothetical protein ENF78_00970 [Candidatus Bathyarchaeota archaeon]|nr:hypothetical protein [Candidatus Bathyarchaeota archaeon]